MFGLVRGSHNGREGGVDLGFLGEIDEIPVMFGIEKNRAGREVPKR